MTEQPQTEQRSRLQNIAERLFAFSFIVLSVVVGLWVTQFFGTWYVAYPVGLVAAFLFFALSGFVFQWLGWAGSKLSALWSAS